MWSVLGEDLGALEGQSKPRCSSWARVCYAGSYGASPMAIGTSDSFAKRPVALIVGRKATGCMRTPPTSVTYARQSTTIQAFGHNCSKTAAKKENLDCPCRFL